MKDFPPVFWYAASAAIALLSIGLTFNLIKSTSLSLEVADSKINLSSRISKTQELTEKLEGTVNKIEASSCPVPGIKQIKEELNETSEHLADIQEQSE